jgi:hypothetical protein
MARKRKRKQQAAAAPDPRPQHVNERCVVPRVALRRLARVAQKPRRRLLVAIEIAVGATAQQLERTARSITFYDAKYRRVCSAKLLQTAKVDVLRKAS